MSSHKAICLLGTTLLALRPPPVRQQHHQLLGVAPSNHNSHQLLYTLLACSCDDQCCCGRGVLGGGTCVFRLEQLNRQRVRTTACNACFYMQHVARCNTPTQHHGNCCIAHYRGLTSTSAFGILLRKMMSEIGVTR